MGEHGDRDRLQKVLYKNYRKIRAACDEAILERLRQEEEYYGSFDWLYRLMQGKDPDTVIEELQKSSERTERLICRIDKAVEDYGAAARSEGMQSWRQYDVMYSMYFSGSFSTAKEISKKFGVKKSVIYRDLKEAEKRLTTLLFGNGIDKSSLF